MADRWREAVFKGTKANRQIGVFGAHNVAHVRVKARQSGESLDCPYRVVTAVDGLVPCRLHYLYQYSHEYGANFFGERPVALLLARVAHSLKNDRQRLHGLSFTFKYFW